MVTEPLAEGTRALSCFGWGTEQNGPRFGAGLGRDVQTCQGRHPWLQADEKVPFKTCPHPGLLSTAAGHAWLGGNQEKGTSQEQMCPTPLPQTLRKRNKLSSAALPAELISETLHIFDCFVSDLHLKCALAASSQLSVILQDFLHMSRVLFLQTAPASCMSLGE